MIALIDYRAGNLTSVRKALAAIGADVFTPETPAALAPARGIIVPGVGHFDATRALDRDWVEAILARVGVGRPVLGICLGMQWLFEGSDEAPDLPGLGLLGAGGRCRRAGDAASRFPHVGWNSLDRRRNASIVDGVADGAQVYFTHSFVAPVTGDTVAATEHGESFAAIVQRGHIAGVQFHPEKSGDVGPADPAKLSAASSPMTSEEAWSSHAAKRIIACLDVRDGEVVKGVNFEGLRGAGDPAELARRYNSEGIDELVILDITATLERRRALADTIRAVARELFIPLAVGGGIRTEDDAAAAIDAGADKVSLNTAALSNPGLITKLAERYGSQAVLVAIDAKKDAAREGRFAVYARSGSTSADRDAVDWAREAESRGAGEILLTSIDRDGTKAGFDCPLTAAVSAAVSIPVIASGGAGGLDDFVEVFTAGRADAALAASIFHYAETSVHALKTHLRQHRIPVRL